MADKDPKGRPGAGRGYRTTKEAHTADDAWKTSVDDALDALFAAAGLPPMDSTGAPTDTPTDASTAPEGGLPTL